MGIFGANVPLLVDVNLLGESILAILLVVALLLAALHKGHIHHYLMLAAFALDLVVFKPIMFSLALNGSNGLFPWEGSQILLHLIVSTIVAVLGLVAIYLGFRKVVRKDGKMLMPRTGRVHRIAGAAFIGLWLATYFIGLYIFVNVWY
jgi:uncharacterized membrane protein YozB (DUF420 family)